MKVISRLQFPQTAETSELYIKLSGDISIDLDGGNSQIVLASGNTLSLNTYFNSIYEKFYTKYTTLRSVYYLLKLEGDFEVAAYRETYSGVTTSKELIFSQTFKECKLTDDVKVSLPELEPSQKAGRIYLEITCNSQQGVFAQGLLVTEQPHQRDLSLAIISCTYKKESYIKKTVKTILSDSLLQEKKWKIFVVDNGRTLNDSDLEADYRLKLISNRNVGGSGGFTKGLIEALHEGVYTHFLFMDDDIDLDSEVIYRLFSLYEYAQQDFVVAGTMLDLYEKHCIHEAGALYDKKIDEQGNIQDEPFALSSLKHDLDLQDSTQLNLLLVEDHIDYGGFWFFSFSKEVVDKIGLPLPFFIKADDMEFGLRINQHFGEVIVAFPSIAVWHEPFYAKKPTWDFYYYTRNRLITGSIHNLFNYWSIIKYLTYQIIYNVLRFDYNTAQMLIKGFEDYLEGPDFIKKNIPETLHVSICECVKSRKSQNLIPNFILDRENYHPTKATKLQKLGFLLTLNGHLLPEFLIKDESMTILHSNYRQNAKRESISKGFTYKRLVFFWEGNPNYYEHQLDKQAAINILLTWVRLVILGTWNWPNVNAEWKKASKEFVSMEFWQDYLEPHNHKTQAQYSVPRIS
jgi:galactofuranosylgalactofuranosylrhamnosyl-N-acetylglucosaminyl-diphospho-decaprenol beta-1,5/1,6-galactofuranosyltransferase